MMVVDNDAADSDVVRGVVVYVDEDADDEVLKSLDALLEEYDPGECRRLFVLADRERGRIA